MSESKQQWTPGPWRIVEREVLEDGSVFPRHIVGGERELSVCLLEGSAVAELAIKEPDSIWGNNTNAKLIAAAPELLEALSAIMDMCDGYVPNTSKAVWDQARAALAKAGAA